MKYVKLVLIGLVIVACLTSFYFNLKSVWDNYILEVRQFGADEALIQLGDIITRDGKFSYSYTKPDGTQIQLTLVNEAKN